MIISFASNIGKYIEDKKAFLYNFSLTTCEYYFLLFPLRVSFIILETFNKIKLLATKKPIKKPALVHYVNHGSREPWKSVNQGKM